MLFLSIGSLVTIKNILTGALKTVCFYIYRITPTPQKNAIECWNKSNRIVSINSKFFLHVFRGRKNILAVSRIVGFNFRILVFSKQFYGDNFKKIERITIPFPHISTCTYQRCSCVLKFHSVFMHGFHFFDFVIFVCYWFSDVTRLWNDKEKFLWAWVVWLVETFQRFSDNLR